MQGTDLEKEILNEKMKGLSDKEIGDKYCVNLKFIEKTITKNFGINISKPGKKFSPKKFEPNNFKEEKNTVWSFKSRGNWATHNGNYRGNWSPYIPRNIILKYSNENDIVLDYFCGSGTTGIEAKLLNRNFIGIDINQYAIELAKENIGFSYLFNPDIKLKAGDARDLYFIADSSIDLICAHPPYANIISYTADNKDDLSNYEVEDFLNEIGKVALESYRVLKDDKYCAILIGDIRRNKNVVPLGFKTIKKYLDVGFGLKELIIKRQHNCKTTGFWYTNSIKYNFLLLAHEYLVVFKKDKSKCEKKSDFELISNINVDAIKIFENNDILLESTTVWVFTKINWISNTLNNLIKRYSKTSYSIYNIEKKKSSLLIYFIDENFYDFISNIGNYIEKEGVFAIICEDKRLSNGLVQANAIKIEEYLSKIKDYKIKEIIIIQIIDEADKSEKKSNLNINHRYILLYQKVG